MRLGLDVNVLIFAIFAAARRGAVLGAAELAAADALVRGWRTEVIQALRHVRTRLKSGPDPAPSAATESLRDQVKRAELDAEQIELAALFAWLEQHKTAVAAPARADCVPSDVARHYRPGNAGTYPPEVEEALRMLSQAADQAGRAS